MVGDHNRGWACMLVGTARRGWVGSTVLLEPLCRAVALPVETQQPVPAPARVRGVVSACARRAALGGIGFSFIPPPPPARAAGQPRAMLKLPPVREAPEAPEAGAGKADGREGARVRMTRGGAGACPCEVLEGKR